MPRSALREKPLSVRGCSGTPDQIRTEKCEGEFLVHKTQGRIFVDAESEFDYDEVVAHLQRVFGISGICPVVHVQDEGFEKLCETVIDYIAKVYPDCNQTFKVAARRARKITPRIP